jgi:WD40 repeat protein
VTFTPWLAALVLSSVQPNGLPKNAIVRLGASPTRLGPVHVAVSADSKRIITVTPDTLVRTFNADTGEPIASRRLVEKVERNVYGGNGGTLAGLTADGGLALVFDGEDYSARSVRVLETETGKLRMKYPSNNNGNNWISSAVLSPDGKKILVNEYGNGNPRHVVIEVATGTSKTFLEQQNGGFVVAAGLMQFSPDGSKILLLDANNVGVGNKMNGTVYNADDGKKLWTEVVGMWPVFTRDSKHVVAIGIEKSTGVRDAATGKEAKLTLPNAADALGQQLTGPNDTALFPLKAGGTQVWDLKKGELIAKLPTGRAPRSTTQGAAFAPGGGFVVTAFNGHLCRWNLPKGERAFGDPMPPGSATNVTRLVYAPDGKKIFSLGEMDMPGTWEIESGKWAGTPQLDAGKEPTENEQMMVFFGGYPTTRSVAYSAAGPRFLTGTMNSPMEVRDGITGKVLSKLKAGDSKNNGNEFHYGTLSADGNTATLFKMNYTGNQSKMTFESWDVNAGAKSNFAEFTFPNYASMANISPCGRFAMFGSKIVALSSGSTLFSIVKTQNQNYYYYGGSSTFSADGRLLATTQNEETMRGNLNSPGTIHLWDVVTGKEIRKIATGANSNAVTFSADNRLIGFASTKGVKVFDANVGKEIAFFPATDLRIPNYYEGVSATSPFAFAPDGRSLATGHTDGTITIWKVPTPADLPEIKPEDFDKYWDAFVSDAPTESRHNVHRLAQNSDVALKLLNAKFAAPVPKPIDVDLPAVIRKFDAPAFADRQAAIKKVKELGPRSVVALQEAIRTTESVEVRARAEELLEQMKAGPKTHGAGSDLRAIRSIEVLERIGSPAAKKLLEGWAQHISNPRIANEASLALQRIAASGK